MPVRAGFATCDVTPPVGSRHIGGLTHAVLKGFRDPLLARAAVLGSGDDRIALVGVDILHLRDDAAAAARDAVQRLCGIPPERVMIAASHTHQGAPAGPGTAEAIASAVAVADSRARDAWLAVDVGHEPSVSFNRRFRMRQGNEVTHPGKANPDIVAPAGPTDPDVGVLSAWDAVSGRLIGCVVNFACHATTLGGSAISADWIFHLDHTVRAVMGDDAVLVYLGGAAGDVTQVDNRSRGERDFGERASRIVGQFVGAEALKVLARARPASDGAEAWPLAAVRRRMVLRARQWPEERLERARDRVAQGEPAGWDADHWRSQNILRLSEEARQRPEVACELQLLQVGPLAFVSNPAEFFCALGLEVKRGSPFPYTFVVTLANGWVGYVPTEAAYGPNGGGYEQGVSRVAPGSGEAIRDGSLDLLRQAWQERPFPAPEWEPVPVGRPWDMGSVRGGE